MANTNEKKLIQRFNQGDQDALCQIYQQYKHDLFGFDLSMLRDAHTAEDLVHDVFVRMAQQSSRFTLTGSLKGYLLTSTANRVRDHGRLKSRRDVSLEQTAPPAEESPSPETCLIRTEDSRRFWKVILQIPYEQREVLLLHCHYDLKFREIARAQGVSINTIQSRYRYGLEKAASLLKEGVDNEIP